MPIGERRNRVIEIDNVRYTLLSDLESLNIRDLETNQVVQVNLTIAFKIINKLFSLVQSIKHLEKDDI